jgi:hypothetical protein
MSDHRSRPLSTFDRVGVVIVALLGTCIGFFAALTTDTNFMGLSIMSPGTLIGAGVASVLGLTAGICVSALANGAIFGLLLYSWDRMANALVDRISR